MDQQCLQYVKYYENLYLLHGSTVNCENELHRNFNIKWQTEIRKAYDCDIDSKLGSYLQVNPQLRTPVPQINLLEIERISITRFRTGSHNLLIETGRYSYPRISRELRICLCGNRVQSIRHVLLECTLLENIRSTVTFTSVI